MTKENILEENAQEVRAQPTAHEVDLKKDVPPLKHGVRLTRDEFERRYDATPHLKKAELKDLIGLGLLREVMFRLFQMRKAS